MKISIIIPVFNEKITLPILLNKIKAVDLTPLQIEKEIILIDDGSNDGTRDYLATLEKEYKVIFHDKNYGKGHAIRTGVKEVTGDIVLIQDADLEYDPNEYAKLVEPIIKGETGVVYGSRNLKFNKRYKWSYYWGGKFLSYLANFLYGTDITDEATCYKLFKTDIIKGISLKCEKFEFCPEVTAKAAKKGYKIIEVPISYNPRSTDEGKKIRLSDGISAIWTLIKYRFID